MSFLLFLCIFHAIVMGVTLEYDTYKKIKESPFKVIYVLGTWASALFFLLAILIVIKYFLSLYFFLTLKVNRLLEYQRKLTRQQKCHMIWPFVVGVLNICILMLRFFVTLYTGLYDDYSDKVMEVIYLNITIIDWVTPYSILYLFMKMSIVNRRPIDLTAESNKTGAAAFDLDEELINSAVSNNKDNEDKDGRVLKRFKKLNYYSNNVEKEKYNNSGLLEEDS
jgi:hypothetical protein